MTSKDQRERLPAAEHSKLADSDPGSYDAYLIDRAVDYERMTAEERRALSHADRSDYLAEAMVLGLRRSTSDEARRDSLDRLMAAARARTTAAQKPRGSDD